jgi:hypothetical protein
MGTERRRVVRQLAALSAVKRNLLAAPRASLDEFRKLPLTVAADQESLGVGVACHLN